LATQAPISFAITLTLFAQFIPVDTSESKFSTLPAPMGIGPIGIYLDASRTNLESLGERCRGKGQQSRDG
jgi:hypothetical protein